MGVIFLDQDDEITTAITRLRASEDIKVALVLPAGSRLGTSRINFRLLAREAQELPRQASIVTTEAGVRAIAVSAGLPAYASVAEYEAAAEEAAGAAAAAGAGAVATAPSTSAVPATPADTTLDRRCRGARGRRGCSRGFIDGAGRYRHGTRERAPCDRAREAIANVAQGGRADR